VANLLSRNVVAITAAISPYRATRDEVRRMTENFIEVYVNAPLEVCTRDVKGSMLCWRNSRFYWN